MCLCGVLCVYVCVCGVCECFVFMMYPHTCSYITTVQFIKDWVLFVIVFVIVLVDATILLVGTAIPHIRLNATLVLDGEHGPDVNVSSSCAIYIYILIESSLFQCGMILPLKP